jgi:[CysO sulfur-carrier protein]-S-L-cysteine hydrolase
MPRIPQAIIEEMVAHSRDDLPNEACGLVVARAGDPITVHRVKNDAASPYRYEMNGLQQMRILSDLDEVGGESLFAIYHSHVASEGAPSPTDVRMAFFPPGELDNEPAYPGTWYILVSLAQDPPPVRAFRILRGGVVEEEPIEVV